MENINNPMEEESYKIAQENWNTNGSLGVTAEDHIAIGSTPDNILIENEGKTLGELMSDSEIQDFINGTKENIKENEDYIKTGPHNANSIINFNKDIKDNLDKTLVYLKKIGRLPVDFK